MSGAHEIASGVAGRAYPPVAFEIDPTRAASFARAIGADPMAGVPPAYAAVYALGATAPQLFADPEAAIDFDRLLHAEQAFEWTRHPRAGETVVARGRVVSDLTRRGVRLVSFESDTQDADGKPVCTSRAVFVIRLT